MSRTTRAAWRARLRRRAGWGTAIGVALALVAASAYALAGFPDELNDAGTIDDPYPAGTTQILNLTVPLGDPLPGPGGGAVANIPNRITVFPPATWARPACGPLEIIQPDGPVVSLGLSGCREVDGGTKLHWAGINANLLVDPESVLRVQFGITTPSPPQTTTYGGDSDVPGFAVQARYGGLLGLGSQTRRWLAPNGLGTDLPAGFGNPRRVETGPDLVRTVLGVATPSPSPSPSSSPTPSVSPSPTPAASPSPLPSPSPTPSPSPSVSPSPSPSPSPTPSPSPSPSPTPSPSPPPSPTPSRSPSPSPSPNPTPEPCVDPEPAERPAGAGDGQSATQVIGVSVPCDAGEFILRVVDDPSVTMTEPVYRPGGFLQSSGDLADVEVIDTRAGGPAWTVSARVGDFTAAGSSLEAGFLGWLPEVAEAGAGAQAGALVSPGFPDGSGLSEPSTLASAPAGHEPGRALLDAAFDLRIPVETAPGDYTATLTITALS